MSTIMGNAVSMTLISLVADLRVQNYYSSSFNPHPVMFPGLYGPPAGPRRPGTMIFKCVEFLEQLKNKNSSY